MIHKTDTLIICVSAGFVLFLNLFFIVFFPRFEGDSIYYDRIAWNVVQGHGYSQSTEAPYEPHFKRPLGYHTFIAIIYYLFGHNHEVVYFIQAILQTLSVLIIYKLAKEVFNSKVALLSMFLYAINPSVSYYASTLMAEVLTTFLISLTIFFLVLSTKKHG
jgi:4-amino-4-deoxy-L-arabinose transferase-like glycosyltransferase